MNITKLAIYPHDGLTMFALSQGSTVFVQLQAGGETVIFVDEL